MTATTNWGSPSCSDMRTPANRSPPFGIAFIIPVHAKPRCDICDLVFARGGGQRCWKGQGSQWRSEGRSRCRSSPVCVAAAPLAAFVSHPVAASVSAPSQRAAEIPRWFWKIHCPCSSRPPPRTTAAVRASGCRSPGHQRWLRVAARSAATRVTTVLQCRLVTIRCFTAIGCVGISLELLHLGGVCRALGQSLLGRREHLQWLS
jgi:hypothetical protein